MEDKFEWLDDSPDLPYLSNVSCEFLNQARRPCGRRAWFLKIDPMRIISMCVCVCVCVRAQDY